MKQNFRALVVVLLLAVLATACAEERRSEQAQGAEVELAGDEPDETALAAEQSAQETNLYDPADTVVRLTQQPLPEYLPNHLRVVLAAYFNIGEGLTNNTAEVAKSGARQLIELLQRHEQENMGLSAEVKEFYTHTAHIMRQSAENMLQANDIEQIRASYSAMAPAAYKMAKVAGYPDTKLYYQYCAEAFNNRGAYWLSRFQEVKNPYGGAVNERCGQTIATL